jgi:adenylate cyclase
MCLIVNLDMQFMIKSISIFSYSRVFISVFFLATSLWATPKLIDGVIDLSELELRNSKKAVAISGDAEFYWERFLSYGDISRINVPKTYQNLPSDWNSTVVDSKKVGGFGFATIHFKVVVKDKNKQLSLKIPSVQTAYKLFLNSTEIGSAGHPSRNKNSVIFDYKPQIISFSPPSDTFSLIFHISNFNNDRGGLWQPLVIGNSVDVQHIRDRAVAYDMTLFGILLFFALYYSLSFILLKEDEISIPIKTFAIFTAVTAIRIPLFGEELVYTFFPEVPVSVVMSINYLTFFLSATVYHNYIHSLFGSYSSEKIRKGVAVISYGLMAVSFFTPLHIHALLVPPFQLFIIIVLIYQLSIAARATKELPVTAAILFFSTFTLFTTAIHDILNNHGLASTLPLIPLGNVIVALAQSYLISKNSSDMHNKNIEVSQTLKLVNNTLAKFVPKDFLEELGRSSLTIKLGDQVTRKMSVLFCDIRNFTTFSEHLSPKESFNFLNNYLALISPHIGNNNGFIDKFLGDGVMAVFPGSPEDAINASIGILEAVNSSSLENKFFLKEKLKVGIGIHYGRMSLGIIGTHSQMEDTVVGDAVNTASRLEKLSKTYGASIVVSEELLEEAILTNNSYHKRRLGTVSIKGKRTSSTVYEIFSPKNSQEDKNKLDSRSYFEQALLLFESGDKRNSRKLFEYANSISTDDKAILHYLNICKQ